MSSGGQIPLIRAESSFYRAEVEASRNHAEQSGILEPITGAIPPTSSSQALQSDVALTLSPFDDFETTIRGNFNRLAIPTRSIYFDRISNEKKSIGKNTTSSIAQQEKNQPSSFERMLSEIRKICIVEEDESIEEEKQSPKSLYHRTSLSYLEKVLLEYQKQSFQDFAVNSSQVDDATSNLNLSLPSCKHKNRVSRQLIPRLMPRLVHLCAQLNYDLRSTLFSHIFAYSSSVDDKTMTLQSQGKSQGKPQGNSEGNPQGLFDWVSTELRNNGKVLHATSIKWMTMLKSFNSKTPSTPPNSTQSKIRTSSQLRSSFKPSHIVTNESDLQNLSQWLLNQIELLFSMSSSLHVQHYLIAILAILIFQQKRSNYFRHQDETKRDHSSGSMMTGSSAGDNNITFAFLEKERMKNPLSELVLKFTTERNQVWSERQLLWRRKKKMTVTTRAIIKPRDFLSRRKHRSAKRKRKTASTYDPNCEPINDSTNCEPTNDPLLSTSGTRGAFSAVKSEGEGEEEEDYLMCLNDSKTLQAKVMMVSASSSQDKKSSGSARSSMMKTKIYHSTKPETCKNQFSFAMSICRKRRRRRDPMTNDGLGVNKTNGISLRQLEILTSCDGWILFMNSSEGSLYFWDRFRNEWYSQNQGEAKFYFNRNPSSMKTTPHASSSSPDLRTLIRKHSRRIRTQEKVLRSVQKVTWQTKKKRKKKKIVESKKYNDYYHNYTNSDSDNTNLVYDDHRSLHHDEFESLNIIGLHGSIPFHVNPSNVKTFLSSKMNEKATTHAKKQNSKTLDEIANSLNLNFENRKDDRSNDGSSLPYRSSVLPRLQHDLGWQRLEIGVSHVESLDHCGRSVEIMLVRGTIDGISFSLCPMQPGTEPKVMPLLYRDYYDNEDENEKKSYNNSKRRRTVFTIGHLHTNDEEGDKGEDATKHLQELDKKKRDDKDIITSFRGEIDFVTWNETEKLRELHYCSHPGSPLEIKVNENDDHQLDHTSSTPQLDHTSSTRQYDNTSSKNQLGRLLVHLVRGVIENLDTYLNIEFNYEALFTQLDFPISIIHAISSSSSQATPLQRCRRMALFPQPRTFLLLSTIIENVLILFSHQEDQEDDEKIYNNGDDKKLLDTSSSRKLIINDLFKILEYNITSVTSQGQQSLASVGLGINSLSNELFQLLLNASKGQVTERRRGSTDSDNETLLILKLPNYIVQRARETLKKTLSVFLRTSRDRLTFLLTLFEEEEGVVERKGDELKNRKGDESIGARDNPTSLLMDMLKYFMTSPNLLLSLLPPEHSEVQKTNNDVPTQEHHLQKKICTPRKTATSPKVIMIEQFQNYINELLFLQATGKKQGERYSLNRPKSFGTSLSFSGTTLDNYSSPYGRPPLGKSPCGSVTSSLTLITPRTDLLQKAWNQATSTADMEYVIELIKHSSSTNNNGPVQNIDYLKSFQHLLSEEEEHIPSSVVAANSTNDIPLPQMDRRPRPLQLALSPEQFHFTFENQKQASISFPQTRSLSVEEASRLQKRHYHIYGSMPLKLESIHAMGTNTVYWNMRIWSTLNFSHSQSNTCFGIANKKSDSRNHRFSKNNNETTTTTLDNYFGLGTNGNLLFAFSKKQQHGSSSSQNCFQTPFSYINENLESGDTITLYISTPNPFCKSNAFAQENRWIDIPTRSYSLEEDNIDDAWSHWNSDGSMIVRKGFDIIRENGKSANARQREISPRQRWMKEGAMSGIAGISDIPSKGKINSCHTVPKMTTSSRVPSKECKFVDSYGWYSGTSNAGKCVSVYLQSSPTIVLPSIITNGHNLSSLQPQCIDQKLQELQFSYRYAIDHLEPNRSGSATLQLHVIFTPLAEIHHDKEKTRGNKDKVLDDESNTTSQRTKKKENDKEEMKSISILVWSSDILKTNAPGAGRSVVVEETGRNDWTKQTKTKGKKKTKKKGKGRNKLDSNNFVGTVDSRWSEVQNVHVSMSNLASNNFQLDEYAIHFEFKIRNDAGSILRITSGIPCNDSSGILNHHLPTPSHSSFPPFISSDDACDLSLAILIGPSQSEPNPLLKTVEKSCDISLAINGTFLGTPYRNVPMTNLYPHVRIPKRAMEQRREGSKQSGAAEKLFQLSDTYDKESKLVYHGDPKSHKFALKDWMSSYSYCTNSTLVMQTSSKDKGNGKSDKKKSGEESTSTAAGKEKIVSKTPSDIVTESTIFYKCLGCVPENAFRLKIELNSSDRESIYRGGNPNPSMLAKVVEEKRRESCRKYRILSERARRKIVQGKHKITQPHSRSSVDLWSKMGGRRGSPNISKRELLSFVQLHASPEWKRDRFTGALLRTPNPKLLAKKLSVSEAADIYLALLDTMALKEKQKNNTIGGTTTEGERVMVKNNALTVKNDALPSQYVYLWELIDHLMDRVVSTSLRKGTTTTEISSSNNVFLESLSILFKMYMNLPEQQNFKSEDQSKLPNLIKETNKGGEENLKLQETKHVDQSSAANNNETFPKAKVECVVIPWMQSPLVSSKQLNHLLRSEKEHAWQTFFLPEELNCVIIKVKNLNIFNKLFLGIQKMDSTGTSKKTHTTDSTIGGAHENDDGDYHPGNDCIGVSPYTSELFIYNDECFATTQSYNCRTMKRSTYETKGKTIMLKNMMATSKQSTTSTGGLIGTGRKSQNQRVTTTNRYQQKSTRNQHQHSLSDYDVNANLDTNMDPNMDTDADWYGAAGLTWTSLLPPSPDNHPSLFHHNDTTTNPYFEPRQPYEGQEEEEGEEYPYNGAMDHFGYGDGAECYFDDDDPYTSYTNENYDIDHIEQQQQQLGAEISTSTRHTFSRQDFLRDTNNTSSTNKRAEEGTTRSAFISFTKHHHRLGDNNKKDLKDRQKGGGEDSDHRRTRHILKRLARKHNIGTSPYCVELPSTSDDLQSSKLLTWKYCGVHWKYLRTPYYNQVNPPSSSRREGMNKSPPPGSDVDKLNTTGKDTNVKDDENTEKYFYLIRDNEKNILTVGEIGDQLKHARNIARIQLNISPSTPKSSPLVISLFDKNDQVEIVYGSTQSGNRSLPSLENLRANLLLKIEEKTENDNQTTFQDLTTLQKKNQEQKEPKKKPQYDRRKQHQRNIDNHSSSIGKISNKKPLMLMKLRHGLKDTLHKLRVNPEAMDFFARIISQTKHFSKFLLSQDNFDIPTAATGAKKNLQNYLNRFTVPLYLELSIMIDLFLVKHTNSSSSPQSEMMTDSTNDDNVLNPDVVMGMFGRLVKPSIALLQSLTSVLYHLQKQSQLESSTPAHHNLQSQGQLQKEIEQCLECIVIFCMSTASKSLSFESLQGSKNFLLNHHLLQSLTSSSSISNPLRDNKESQSTKGNDATNNKKKKNRKNKKKKTTQNNKRVQSTKKVTLVSDEMKNEKENMQTKDSDKKIIGNFKENHYLSSWMNSVIFTGGIRSDAYRSVWKKKPHAFMGKNFSSSRSNLMIQPTGTTTARSGQSDDEKFMDNMSTFGVVHNSDTAVKALLHVLYNNTSKPTDNSSLPANGSSTSVDSSSTPANGSSTSGDSSTSPVVHSSLDNQSTSFSEAYRVLILDQLPSRRKSRFPYLDRIIRMLVATLLHHLGLSNLFLNEARKRFRVKSPTTRKRRISSSNNDGLRLLRIVGEKAKECARKLNTYRRESGLDSKILVSMVRDKARLLLSLVSSFSVLGTDNNINTSQGDNNDSISTSHGDNKSNSKKDVWWFVHNEWRNQILQDILEFFYDFSIKKPELEALEVTIRAGMQNALEQARGIVKVSSLLSRFTYSQGFTTTFSPNANGANVNVNANALQTTSPGPDVLSVSLLKMKGLALSSFVRWIENCKQTQRDMMIDFSGLFLSGTVVSGTMTHQRILKLKAAMLTIFDHLMDELRQSKHDSDTQQQHIINHGGGATTTNSLAFKYLQFLEQYQLLIIYAIASLIPSLGFHAIDRIGPCLNLCYDLTAKPQNSNVFPLGDFISSSLRTASSRLIFLLTSKLIDCEELLGSLQLLQDNNHNGQQEMNGSQQKMNRGGQEEVDSNLLTKQHFHRQLILKQPYNTVRGSPWVIMKQLGCGTESTALISYNITVLSSLLKSYKMKKMPWDARTQKIFINLQKQLSTFSVFKKFNYSLGDSSVVGTYSLLLTILVSKPSCLHRLARPEWVSLLLRLMENGPLFLKRRVLRLFRKLLPILTPSDFSKIIEGMRSKRSGQFQSDGAEDERGAMTFVLALLRDIGRYYSVAKLSERGRERERAKASDDVKASDAKFKDIDVKFKDIDSKLEDIDTKLEEVEDRADSEDAEQCLIYGTIASESVALLRSLLYNTN
eukprot:g1667.t1